MKNSFTFGDNVERWSPALAIIGAALIIVGVLAWVLGGAPTGEEPRYLVVMQAAFAGGLICVLAALAMRPSLWLGLLGVRQMRYGLNTLIMSGAFIAIVMLVNYVAAQPRFYKQWDITDEQRLTLSQNSIDLIKNLEQPVEIVGFYSVDQSSQQDSLETLLKRYQQIEGQADKLTYRFLDPTNTINIATAIEFGLSSQSDFGSVFAVQGDKHQKLEGTDEQAVSGAIWQLENGVKFNVDFLAGHGELQVDEGTWGEARRALESANYIMGSTIITATSLPTRTNVLVIASPLVDFKQSEVDTIKAYIEAGGNVLLLVDPDLVMQQRLQDPNATPPKFGGPLATYLSATWGISLTNDLVLDQQSLSQPALVSPVITDYPTHIITEKLALPTAMLYVRSIVLGPQPDGITIDPFLLSSAQSWGETDLSGAQPQPDQGVDVIGPVTMAVAGNRQAGGRIIVMGSSSWLSDNFAISVPNYANRSLWLSIINWLVGRAGATVPDFRAVPGDAAQRTIVASDAVRQYVAFSSICLIPGLVVIAGVVVFIQRRRQS